MRDTPYADILASVADDESLFSASSEPPGTGDANADAQRIRATLAVLPTQVCRPTNPYRRRSIRRFAFELLATRWISLADLRAAIGAYARTARADWVIAQITSITAQVSHGYRIVEANGQFKAFRRFSEPSE